MTTVVCYSPGSVGGTGLTRGYARWYRGMLQAIMYFPWVANWIVPALECVSPQSAADTMLYVATDPTMDRASSRPVPPQTDPARYIGPHRCQKPMQGGSNDRGLCTELWKDTAAMLGLPTDN